MSAAIGPEHCALRHRATAGHAEAIYLAVQQQPFRNRRLNLNLHVVQSSDIIPHLVVADEYMGAPMNRSQPAVYRSLSTNSPDSGIGRTFRGALPRLIVAVACLLAIHPASVAARDAATWKVHGKLLGKAEPSSEVEKSTDVSGIACDRDVTFPRICIVADDETQGAQIVVLGDGKLVAGDFIKLTDTQYRGKPLELDAEAVAFEDGSFYVVGSHGRARHEPDQAKEAKVNARAAATRQIFRITLRAAAVDMQTGKLRGKADVQPSSLTVVLQSQPEIARAYDQALADNGLTIEGLAVRDRRLYIGMRGPVLGSDAAILSVAAPAVFEGQPADPKLHRLALQNDTLGNPRGVRDLARYGNGFLVLAGPVNDPPEGTKIKTGDYSIYSWDGENRLNRLVDLEGYGKKVKPEALLPLDGDDQRMRVLLMFDGPTKGAPRPITVKLN
ncbi:DUF3616 domain-containing protein [Tardiphaga sp.]|uniref:DUF3616 domain-containing protein n=1 Tax=Tardiphaga sp. TaxID=1926292 RepID=UPI0025D58394|nr:DUF3616 domain-containing protein [Tardiphaga sp.]